MVNTMSSFKTILAILLFALATAAQRDLGTRPTATGGPLKFEEAVYDVQSYDVSINADPKTKSITGTTVMTARTVYSDKCHHARSRHAVYY